MNKFLKNHNQKPNLTLLADIEICHFLPTWKLRFQNEQKKRELVYLKTIDISFVHNKEREK